ncbi:hypothetical protein [Bacteriovorax sp. Seq25_V]|uniref:hypothetical protein n=1 Tax=Bacteriovorax sp. Seq25_V TaxID=1201288 RepID=UPI000389E9C0|nr:hypothetical protein [Bacteriovorax sp. Seq25_V]EQC47157.1 hypothetical protein M900_0762 [Bacteriovorax sp. Seq25_V]
MKIAIIGNGALALECASYFYELGADIRLFKKNSGIDNLLYSGVHDENYQALYTSWSNIDTPKENSKESYLTYLEKLEASLLSLNVIKYGDVKRIHKRVLRPGVMPADGKSRLVDLFRVVFKIDATKEIERQRLENTEIFEKLGNEVLESLKNSIESYEDFDLVINATGYYHTPLPMGPGDDYAINEIEVSKDNSNVFYGLVKKEDLEDARVITLVGDDLLSLINLEVISELFKEKENLRLQIVCESSNPFFDRDRKSINSRISNFHNLIQFNQNEFDRLIKEFEVKINEWKALDDHVRAKKPRPAEPASRLTIFNGATVSAVDKLLDQNGLFLTIEGSELLSTREQLKTIGTDKIIVSQGVARQDEFEKLVIDEVGYFRIKNESLAEGLSEFKNIENDMMKFFSRAED